MKDFILRERRPFCNTISRSINYIEQFKIQTISFTDVKRYKKRIRTCKLWTQKRIYKANMTNKRKIVSRITRINCWGSQCCNRQVVSTKRHNTRNRTWVLVLNFMNNKINRTSFRVRTLSCVLHVCNPVTGSKSALFWIDRCVNFCACYIIILILQ